MNFAKTAADIIRDYPRLRKENEDLKGENAKLKKEARVRDIVEQLHLKQASIPDGYDRDLMEAPDDQLDKLELALRMFTPDGSLKLASGIEEEGAAPRRGRNSELTELEQLLLDPESFGIELDARRD